MKKITKMLVGVLVLLGIVLPAGRVVQASMPAKLYYTLTGVDAYVDGNDKSIASSGRDVRAVGGPLEGDAVGKNITFNLTIWQEALAKAGEKGINSIRYSCTVSLKNDNGGYDQLAEVPVTNDTTYKYVYKIEKAGSYKFSFNEYHDDRQALSSIDMDITVKDGSATTVPDTTTALSNAQTTAETTGQNVTQDAGTAAKQSDDENANKNNDKKAVSVKSVKISKGKISGKVIFKTDDTKKTDGNTVGIHKEIKAKIKIGRLKYCSLKIKKDGSFNYRSKQIKKGATIKIKLINGKKVCIKKYTAG